ncbi:MAG: dihydropteroate synthase [Gallionella sp.]
MMLSCGAIKLDLSRSQVMGIVNVTPDSFFDGGVYGQRDAAIAHAIKLIDDGANMIDIGGESTRPGAQPVGVQEELDRVLPIIEAMQGISVPISIDTFKPEVMRAAIAVGVNMVNDINALQDEAAMNVVAGSDVAICLMHKQGVPLTMQRSPDYQAVLPDVAKFLRNRIAAARVAGIAAARIVIDPGFGFGKTLVHNIALLRELNQFTQLGAPILAGLSRKSMLGEITGQDATQRLPASISAALIAVQRGASIVRVHDVRATVDALRIWNALTEEVK